MIDAPASFRQLSWNASPINPSPHQIVLEDGLCHRRALARERYGHVQGTRDVFVGNSVAIMGVYDDSLLLPFRLPVRIAMAQ